VFMLQIHTIKLKELSFCKISELYSFLLYWVLFHFIVPNSFTVPCTHWVSELLFAENGPQGDTFRNHVGHKIECDSLLRVLPTMAGSMEEVRGGRESVCVRAQASPCNFETTIFIK
jgi:hypothetical protein